MTICDSDHLTSDYPVLHPKEYEEGLQKLVETFKKIQEALVIIDKITAPVSASTPQLSEKQLKKLIKYAKTPMERKQYEQQLNKLYKERKKHKSND